MPMVVIDTSATLALVLADEEGADVASVVREVVVNNGQILVPSLFWYELGNGMLSAERARGIGETAWEQASALLGRLPLVTDTDLGEAARGRIMSVAEEHALTYYDAAYLELALRLHCRLKSFDAHLLALSSRYPLIG